MMHAFPGSQKISQEKFSEHEFDETKVKFIQIYCGEAVFKSLGLYLDIVGTTTTSMLLDCQNHMFLFMTLQFISTSIYLDIILLKKL